MPPSSTKALAIRVTSWRWWSKATSRSVIIRAMSGRPTGSGVWLTEGLDGADQVVAEEADSASGERRQLIRLRDLEATEVVRDRRVRIGSRDDAIPVALPCPSPGAALAAPLREPSVVPPENRARGGKPRKDQRPSRPCSADSRRNAGPSPRSLRKALTGVSRSSDEAVANRDDVRASRQLTGRDPGPARGRGGCRWSSPRSRSSRASAGVQDLKHLGHRGRRGESSRTARW